MTVAPQMAIRPGRAPGYVVLAQDPSADRVLVCFHYAGGSAQTFHSWRKRLPQRYALLSVELPGRGRRQGAPFAESIQEVAEQLASDFSEIARQPTVFYGHSLGALVAYETARSLRRRSLPEPKLLIASCRAAPGSAALTDSLPALSDADLRRYLEALRGTPKAILENRALMDFTIPILRADLELIYGYRHVASPRLVIPIEVIGAVDDRWAPLECLLEWRSITDGDFRLRMLPGGHFAPLASPETVLQAIDLHLSDSLSEKDRIAPLGLATATG
jgi:surfactin synthase thioesterase subunit